SWMRAGKPTGKRTLSKDEIRSIFEVLAADVEEHSGWNEWRARRIQALIYVIAYLGLRRTEALRLRVADVDLPGRVINVQPYSGHRLKTETSAAAVPIPEAAVEVLANWLDRRMDAPKGFPMPPEGSVWLFPGSRRKTPWIGGVPGTKALDVFKEVS